MEAFKNWLVLLAGVAVFVVPGLLFWLFVPTSVQNKLYGLAVLVLVVVCLWSAIRWFFTDVKPEIRWWLLVAVVATVFFIWLFMASH
jgi:hypothetical protein